MIFHVSMHRANLLYQQVSLIVWEGILILLKDKPFLGHLDVSDSLEHGITLLIFLNCLLHHLVINALSASILVIEFPKGLLFNNSCFLEIEFTVKLEGCICCY